MSNNKIALLTTIHDPDGNLVNHTQDYLPKISSLFDLRFCEVTQETSQKLIKILHPNILLNITPKNGMAQARRQVLSFGLESDATYFFHCDFDRLLFWIAHYPEELEKCLDYTFRYDFIVYGRTYYAFETHPELQRITERAGNALCRYVLNLSYSFFPHYLSIPEIDFLSGTRSFSYKVGKYLKRRSYENGAKIDIEWPLSIQASEYYSSGYTEVEGLAYETDFCNSQRSELEELELRLKNLSDIQEFVEKYRK